MSGATYSEKVKSYMKIFWILCFLTVLELAFLALPLSPLVITILVCTASIAKAVYVGWYFMHLNHETKFLKIVAILPIIAFVYAVILIYDTKSDLGRQQVEYIPTPARVFESDSHGEKDPMEEPQVPAGGTTEEDAEISGEDSEATETETSEEALEAEEEDNEFL